MTKAQYEALIADQAIKLKEQVSTINNLRARVARMGGAAATGVGATVRVTRNATLGGWNVWNGQVDAGHYTEFLGAHSKAIELRTSH